MAAKERCAYGDIEFSGIVEPVFFFLGGGGGGLFDSRQKHKARRCHKCSGQCS